MIGLPIVLLFCFTILNYFPSSDQCPMNLHPEQPLPQPYQRVSSAISQVNQPLNRDHLLWAPSNCNLHWSRNASPGLINSNRDRPIKVKPVSKSKRSSLAQEKSWKLSNPLLNHLSASSISTNLELLKLQREGGVVSELSEKHHHQVDHLNWMMIENHDHPD